MSNAWRFGINHHPLENKNFNFLMDKYFLFERSEIRKRNTTGLQKGRKKVFSKIELSTKKYVISIYKYMWLVPLNVPSKQS